MSRGRGDATPALAVLTAAGIAYTVHTYEHDPRAASYGLEAADALGVDPDRVFKTLMVELDPTELVVAIVPVTTTVDLKAVAATFGAKRAVMADPQAAQRATGYVLGGSTPLGQRQPHRTAVDETAQMWDTIHVSAGRRGLEIELDPQDLIASVEAVVAPVARP